MNSSERICCDVIVVGSGPAGQAAAMHAARAGKTVVLIEQEQGVGGACVHRGTIPSKTLRETALTLVNFARRTGGVFRLQNGEDLQVASLMTRKDAVIRTHAASIADHLQKDGVQSIHGRARFTSPHDVQVVTVSRRVILVKGDVVVIAAGSRPRAPADVPVDHEHVLDSDSILSMIYLPQTLTVLGGGVIACEYASIFAALGVKVTIIDRADVPLKFLDPDLTSRFLRTFQTLGGRFIGGRAVKKVEWDGVQSVTAQLEGGIEVKSDKLLCCLGRIANVDDLDIGALGLKPNERGLISVDENGRTAVPHVYAIGDVVGPPSLASTSADQGRRAICAAFGLKPTHAPETIPMGIYTIPEMASVGLTEADAVAKYGAAIVGRASFSELARGQIAALDDGLLKLVCDPDGGKLLGVQIVGEGASELIHVGQMALIAGDDVDVFVDNTFNFPTLAEAYRVAALDVVWRRQRELTAAAH